jgi:hypothetical protein
MGHKSIGYHTRLYGNNKVKCCGGSFGGDISQDTVERVVNCMFTVIVKPSGTPVFVDKQGREVYLYFTIDARNTEKGKEALTAFYAEREKASEVLRQQERHLEDVLSSMSTHDILQAIEDYKNK